MFKPWQQQRGASFCSAAFKCLTHTPGGLNKSNKSLSSRCRKRYLIILSPTADPREFTLDLWRHPRAGNENGTIAKLFLLKKTNKKKAKTGCEVPLSLTSEPGGGAEDGVVVTVLRVLVAPGGLAGSLLLLFLLAGGLSPPAAPRRVLGAVLLAPLSGGRGGAAGLPGAGGVTGRLGRGGCGRLALWPRGLGGSWGDVFAVWGLGALVWSKQYVKTDYLDTFLYAFLFYYHTIMYYYYFLWILLLQKLCLKNWLLKFFCFFSSLITIWKCVDLCCKIHHNYKDKLTQTKLWINYEE